MSQQTTVDVQALEREVLHLRQALKDIAETGRELLERMPTTRAVPLFLAQGPLLTLTGLAEAALTDGGSTT
jgi:hypothetical protein